ncbi:FAD-dependent oxidoreductase [Lacrimispora sp.]|uniref:FAD-dependent oxidoreductase n=1 Tax=Lacrimispora sp. TaxID=2719234 RepID=UPI00289C68D6|nr:FAD-dependent oxidoreductase [Lacrimispora sp.]
MKYITENKREIPVIREVDVLVLGAGPAGIGAAVAAAREGAVTMLVEQAGDVGGIATAGLMSHWTGSTEGGFYEEILSRSAEFSGEGRQIINPERLKTVFLRILMEAGVSLRLYTFASDVVMEGNVIKGVILESKSGREAVLAKIVIDSTGDGDIAAKAGAPYFKGREGDGLMQPATIMFKVAGVDEEKGVFPAGFEESFDLPDGDLQELGKKHLPEPAGHVLLYKSTLPGVVTCNMTNCTGVDGTSAEDLTKATLVCREQIEKIVAFLRRYVPGFENCYIISSASLVGIRETRHFKGVETIRPQDILEARVFDNWVVAKACFNFDVHNLTGNGLDETGSQKHFPQTKGYTIPYGCFVPLEIDNLYLAGRNISGTHMAHSNYRVMPICANMGQSVGIAAAMCAASETVPRDLEVKKIQSRLMELGVNP